MSANFPQDISLANPTGYIMSEKARLPKHKLSSTLLIQKALKDPVYLNRLCDRVYQIMLTDLQQQQRKSNYIGL